jgi:hypothetical protein
VLGSEPHPQSTYNIYARCGQSRSSTAIERPNSFSGDVGSIPIGRATFDGPLSLDYRKSSLEDEWVRIPRHQATDEIHLASCPSLISFGPNVVGYLAKWKSTGLLSRSCRFDSCGPTQSLARLPFGGRAPALSTGRRIGLSPHKHVVAGSSPASGSSCRGSSAVEHVKFPVRFLSVVPQSQPTGRNKAQCKECKMDQDRNG